MLGRPRTPEENLNDLAATLARLEQLGVRVLSASRFRVYERVLQSAAAGRPVDMESRSHAHLEVSQLVSIGRHLLEQPQPSVLEKLRTMMTGPPVVRDLERHTPERDAQFELVLAGIYMGAGLAVQIEEPDLIVECDDLSIGIAAKRVKSWGQLRKRLDEAREQLARRWRRVTNGVIALDVTSMTNPEGLVSWSGGVPDEQNRAAVFTSMVRRPIADALSRWDEEGFLPRLACGVLVRASVVHYLPDEGGAVGAHHFRMCGADVGRKFVRDRLRMAAMQAFAADEAA
jgi:hypothetical protein